MSAIATHLLTFLAGIAAAMAGSYFAAKYTDERRRKESVKLSRTKFNEIELLMPDLVSLMSSDLSAHPIARDFFPYHPDAICAPDPYALYYDPDKITNLIPKIDILLSKRFIEDISDNHTKKYRMTEEFAKLLSTKKS